jgi:hypothetical protein
MLLAGVRRTLLEAPRVINWDLVFESVQHALPGRTKAAIQKRWHAWASSPGLLAQLPEDAAAGGLVKAPWTQQEAAVLRSAVEDAQRTPGHTVDWIFLAQHTPALAGRTPRALVRYWHSHLATTPAALAMLREVEEALAGGGRADPAAAAAAAAPPPPPPPTPFHMLHSLRSAGCLDEQALRVCWLAAAQALQR